MFSLYFKSLLIQSTISTAVEWNSTEMFNLQSVTWLAQDCSHVVKCLFANAGRILNPISKRAESCKAGLKHGHNNSNFTFKVYIECFDTVGWVVGRVSGPYEW